MASTHILIVIDPTAKHHPAHQSLLDLHETKSLDTSYTILLTLNPDGVDTHADNGKVFVDAALIERLEAPFKALNAEISTRISWSHEWAAGILNTADTVNADFISVSHPGRENTQFADDYWKLIRSTTCPLIIVNPLRTTGKPIVLTAIDLQDDAIRDRNVRIFEAAKRSAELWDAELHLVNAYADSSSYPDRGRFVSLTGLPNENIHIEQGEPDEVLGKVTRELDPMLLVVGATRRNTGIRAALRGVKIARVFNKIERDIMVVT